MLRLLNFAMHTKAGRFVRQRPTDTDSTTDTTSSASDGESAEDDEGHMEAAIKRVSPVQISRRRAMQGHFRVQRNRRQPPTDGTRDVAGLQRLWQDHAAQASELYPRSVWRVLYAVRNESKVTQSNVLAACQKMLPKHQYPLWPTSRKTINAKIIKSLGSFTNRVMRVVHIDLSHHALPGLAKPIAFRFLDPIYAWSRAAYTTSEQHELHFQYKEHLHPITFERLYGSSVAHGDIMREACRQVPGEPALIGISYDSGQASKRRSYIPIVVSVANTDARCHAACICIGYLPDLCLESTHSTDDAKGAMHELRQACIGAIFDAVEECGQHGFMCLLRGTRADGTPVDIERNLFPIVCCMEFDTKERTKFFCCHKQHACGIGSGPRQGRSALRPCTPHASRADLAQKRLAASDPSDPLHDVAVASLIRRGIHPSRQCTALMGLQYCLLNWPGRIHHGLFSFNCLHNLYLNTIGYLLDALLEHMTPTKKRELDSRARTLGSFRDHKGVTCRRLNRLSSTGYLSAEMMVLSLFIWTHALGSRGLLLPEAIRGDALTALSSLQLICYSVRGSRDYTEAEHRHVFEVVGRRFYRALTNIAHCKRLEKIAAAEAYNADKPPAKRRRVPHWKPAKIAENESSDTASSTDDDLPPYYLRSDKIVPHGLQHFAQQVKMGGNHRFHDNDMQESTHTANIGRAGERARTYHDVNDSSAAMMDFLNERQLLEEICVQADVVEDDTESGCPQDLLRHPQDITHRTSPTGHHPQDITHRTLPTGHYPQDITHRTLPTGHYPLTLT